jgi:alkanesulfonate monooxygenase SsuD/methylene tetrahydromethanopterin reductase-like flavin-dependent oxidoreductase (luciferase family)
VLDQARSVRICAGLPIWGDVVEEHGLDRMVGMAREADIDGLWVGDHVALSRGDESVYPGRESGQFFLDPTEAWYEALATLGFIAAHAGAMDLGLGVALPVLRPPVLMAKQMATLSRLAEGRVSLGVGAGWQRAEYEAVGVPWEERGARLTSCIEVIRECWSGEPAPGTYGAYLVPPGLTSYPVPRRPIPLLVGGSAPPALRRASRLGDGWIGALRSWDRGLDEADRLLGAFLAAHRADPSPRVEEPELALVLPVPGSVARRPGFAAAFDERVDSLIALGFRTLVLGFSWRRLDRAGEMLELLASATGRLK